MLHFHSWKLKLVGCRVQSVKDALVGLGAIPEKGKETSRGPNIIEIVLGLRHISLKDISLLRRPAAPASQEVTGNRRLSTKLLR
jgi:hypothetical protein